MAFQDLFCSLVNWKLLRDTALNYCLTQLLTCPTKRPLSIMNVEASALILQGVEPCMMINWGLTSCRYLNAYYLRIQSCCQHQMLLSSPPAVEHQRVCVACVVSP